MYPEINDTIDILSNAARRAAVEQGSGHPEDIATAMIFAIETSWPVIVESYKKFNKA